MRLFQRQKQAGSFTEEHAQIRIHLRQLPTGHIKKDYEWLGDPKLPTVISRFSLGMEDLPHRTDGSYPHRLRVGPYALRFVREMEYNSAGVYVRADSGWWNWLRHALPARCRHFATRLRVRFIVTLHIWGLAYVPQSEIPSWCHVRKKRQGS